jgi:hypothetical protein
MQAYSPVPEGALVNIPEALPQGFYTDTNHVKIIHVKIILIKLVPEEVVIF